MKKKKKTYTSYLQAKINPPPSNFNLFYYALHVSKIINPCPLLDLAIESNEK